jgi:hypothetical protein
MNNDSNDDEYWKHKYDQFPPIEGNLSDLSVKIVVVVCLVALLALFVYLV